MAAASDSPKANSLTASYASPSGNSTFTSTPLPSISAEPSTSDTSSHLSAMRAAATSLQSDINAFLTAKMEEDKRAEGAKGAAAADDGKEEENYGEEEVDGAD